MVRSDNNIYALNGAAVGDLVAAAPSIKYAIDNYHHYGNYRVALLPDFRDIFHFVPTSKIIPTSDKYDSKYAVRMLNMNGPGGNVTRLTPSRLKLVDYASIGLLGRVLDPIDTKYIPLQEVDISHYGIDFSKCAIFLTTYRDITRAWKGEDIVNTAKYVYDKGLTPVFVGRKGAISIWKTLAVSDFEYPGFGHDLIDKTSLRELYTIMSKSAVIFGLDSGPLHIAFSTNTPVIAGFTNVRPDLRIPYRDPGVQTIPVETTVSCKFCQSDWNLDFHNFTSCPKGMKTPKCTTSMTADIFINAFDKLER
jgi:hypothetical protein